jgi:hypothetical protein
MKKVLSTLLVLVLIAVAGVSLIGKKEVSTLGSVVVGNEDTSTTTIGKAGVTAYQVPECTNRLGTVNIIGATALSALTIKDATSTSDLQAITIAEFPATALGGTYLFDRYLTRGLQLTIASGNGASTTITCR